jgi:hypothetical protein
LVTSVLSNGVGLTLVLLNRLVDLSYDIITDGSGEDGGKRKSAGRLSVEGTDVNNRSAGHFRGEL